MPADSSSGSHPPAHATGLQTVLPGCVPWEEQSSSVCDASVCFASGAQGVRDMMAQCAVHEEARVVDCM
jgi:hypothetical protein